MAFKIPYSFLPTKALSILSHPFMGAAYVIRLFFPFLKLHLHQSNIDYTPQKYLAMCLASLFSFFILVCFALTSLLLIFNIKKAFMMGITVAIILAAFAFLQQIFYPKMLANKKIRGIEQNLLPALQNILVQLNSGVPLFTILVNISTEDYGEVSDEFRMAVKEINAGRPQIEALEDMAAKNPSLYFRRAVWQIINGMKAGSNIGSVIEGVIDGLGEEQLLQIRNYGSQLNPLAMFYMLLAVIIPALSVTFVTMISSFLALTETATKMVLWGIYGFILFFQVMFLGIIKSRRPNLLS